MAASVTQEQDGVSWLEDTQCKAANEPDLALPTLNTEQYQQLMSLLNKQQTEGPSSGPSVGSGFLAGEHFCFHTSFAKEDWIIDSGASDHITPDLSLLDDWKVVHGHCSITMPNGKLAEIKHVGSMQLQPGLVLNDVFAYTRFSLQSLIHQQAN